MVDRNENQLPESRIFFLYFLHPILPFSNFEFCEWKINNFDAFLVVELCLLKVAEKGVGLGLVASRS